MILKRIRSKRRAASIAEDAEVTRHRAQIRLHEVGFEDCENVSALKSQLGLRSDSLANWYRLWRNNPAMSTPDAVPMGWVLESTEGIVGYLGNIPLRCFYQRKPLRVATCHGLAVRPSYRAHTLGLVASYFRQKDIDLFVSTSANESAGKLYASFKAQPLPQQDYGEVPLWVINSHRFLTAVRKKLAVDGAVGALSARVGGWLLRMESALRRRRPFGLAAQFRLSQIGPGDISDEFDGLWLKKLGETPRLIADRSVASLRWHFNIPGDRRETTILRCVYSGRLVGYAVVTSETVEGIDLRKASLVDLLVENEDPAVIQQLVVAAYEFAHSTNQDVLELLGLPRTARQICAKWNPYARKYPSSPYLFKAADPGLQLLLKREESWYATPYDGDATLMP